MWYVAANDCPSVNDLIDPQFGQYFAEELRQNRMKTVFCDDVNKSLNENYIE